MLLVIERPEEKHAVAEAEGQRRYDRMVSFAAGLKARGVLVKHIAGLHPLLANCLRLTVGTPSENTAMLGALRAALADPAA